MVAFGWELSHGETALSMANRIQKLWQQSCFSSNDRMQFKRPAKARLKSHCDFDAALGII
jgi:hypothetical protein